MNFKTYSKILMATSPIYWVEIVVRVVLYIVKLLGKKKPDDTK